MIENRTGPQTIEFLTKRVVALGAVQVGQFLVDCETYMSVPQLGKCVFSSCDLASSEFREFETLERVSRSSSAAASASTRPLAQMAVAWAFKDPFREMPFVIYYLQFVNSLGTIIVVLTIKAPSGHIRLFPFF